ncbi:MAG: FadR/GntR family transcriptional regulator [Anaerolineaceae bacterium]|jgi:GntR family transcriptional repressor for pyruvate dehydrogenase complex|nr:FadR/GntR family transcriptional regulator [Anaerolineaceae bacterium]
MKYKRFVKQSVPEEIVKEILQLIQNGELKPGDQLPTERELMEQLDVSRSSIREALRALSVMNVINIRQGHGTYVSSLDPHLLVEHLEFVVSLEDATILHLFEVRKMIEVYCAELAAKRIKPEEISQLKMKLELEDVRNIDIGLHSEIARLSKNPILIRIYSSIERLSQISRNRTGSIPGVREQASIDHENIVNAIISNDPEESRKRMLEHLQFVERKLKEDLAAHGTSSYSKEIIITQESAYLKD